MFKAPNKIIQRRDQNQGNAILANHLIEINQGIGMVNHSQPKQAINERKYKYHNERRKELREIDYSNENLLKKLNELKKKQQIPSLANISQINTTTNKSGAKSARVMTELEIENLKQKERNRVVKSVIDMKKIKKFDEQTEQYMNLHTEYPRTPRKNNSIDNFPSIQTIETSYIGDTNQSILNKVQP